MAEGHSLDDTSPLRSDFSSKPRALSKFFSILFTLLLSLFTDPARFGKPLKETFALNHSLLYS